MSWIPFTDARTGQVWQVSQEGLYLLVRSNARAALVRSNSSIETIDGGFLSPNTYQASTDWASVRKNLDSETNTLFEDAERRLAVDGVTNMPINLAGLRDEAIAKTAAFEALQKKAQSDTYFSIDSTVQGLKTAETVLTFVRDASVTILLAGAAVLSGGTALAVLGAASGLKGVGKYQDTGKVGVAVVEGVGTFVVGALTIKAPGVEVSSADDKVLVFVASAMDGTFEGVKAVMDGQSGKTALEQAVARAGASALLGMSGLKMANMSNFVRVSANTVGTTVADAGVGKIPPVPQPPPSAQATPQKPATSGALDFATAILSQQMSSAQFVSQFVLRRPPGL